MSIIETIRMRVSCRTYSNMAVEPDKTAKLTEYLKSNTGAPSKALIISNTQDQIIYPEPAKTFARLLKTETAELTGDCGHLAFLCESERLRMLVEGFLKRDTRIPDKE